MFDCKIVGTPAVTGKYWMMREDGPAFLVDHDPETGSIRSIEIIKDSAPVSKIDFRRTESGIELVEHDGLQRVIGVITES